MKFYRNLNNAQNYYAKLLKLSICAFWSSERWSEIGDNSKWKIRFFLQSNIDFVLLNSFQVFFFKVDQVLPKGVGGSVIMYFLVFHSRIYVSFNEHFLLKIRISENSHHRKVTTVVSLLANFKTGGIYYIVTTPEKSLA